MNNENLSAIDVIINTVTTYVDHAYHGRPGMVTENKSTAVGVEWQPVFWKLENDEKIVYSSKKLGKKTIRTKLGSLREDGKIVNNGRVIGEFRDPGLFKEVVVWLYKQIAEVYSKEQEFVARWCSYAFNRKDHNDLKVLLAAFLLVQDRKGDPVMEDGKLIFRDVDYRSVGEATILIADKANRLEPKYLQRVHDILAMPEIAEINRKLGFGKSAKNPFVGRYNKAIEKWLSYRDLNPKLLEGLVRGGGKNIAKSLSRIVGFKPSSSKFFETLGWKQSQAKDGRRTIAIGKTLKKVETWEGLTEEQICKRIAKERPAYKKLVGMLPKSVGLTRAIFLSAFENGGFSDVDLVIATDTIEDLGLMQVPQVKERWEKAVNTATTRAANLAKNVKNKETRDKMEEGAVKVAQKAIENDVNGLRIHFIVDKSGSMGGAIEKAVKILSRLISVFPLDKVHVAVFDATAREIKIPHASVKGVEKAFEGISASGGTNYASAVRLLSKYASKTEDNIIFACGDEEDSHTNFIPTVRESGINPVAFGLIRVLGTSSNGHGRAVQNTAAGLGIPCFMIDEKTFDDVSAIPRTIRNLILSTPVGISVIRQESLAEKIASCPLLQLPAWAQA